MEKHENKANDLIDRGWFKQDSIWTIARFKLRGSDAVLPIAR